MAAVDLTQVVSAVNFSTTTVAILAVGAVLIGVFVVFAASMFVLGMVRGQVYYGGRFWDRDVYESALHEVSSFDRKGFYVDSESLRVLKSYDWLDKPHKSSGRMRSTRV